MNAARDTSNGREPEPEILSDNQLIAWYLYSMDLALVNIVQKFSVVNMIQGAKSVQHLAFSVERIA
jgi:hypothetical protein